MASDCSPVHFYHLWHGGDWQAIAAEHQRALSDAGFTGSVLTICVDEGFEDVTLRVLRKACEPLPGETPVLYAHSKGALNPSPENVQRRRSMTAHLVTNWRARVAELASHDVCSWGWLEGGLYKGFASPWPHAPGNFWWARADYLRGLPYLPALKYETRLEAERWVGQDCPAVCALDYGERL